MSNARDKANIPALNFSSTGIDDNATSTAITINSSEQVAFTDGTASLPSITNLGDENTGMFFPAANQIGFATNGSETVRINANGAMALGTNTIEDKLHVFNGNTGSNTGTGIRLGQGYNSVYSRIASNFGGTMSIQAGIGAATASILFSTNSITRQQLVSNGDVYFYEDTGTTPKFVWDASAESLGIGTTVSTATLNVLADSGSQGIDVLGRSSDNRSRIQLISNDGSTVYSQWDYSGTAVELISATNLPLVFRTNAIERMRITSSGNVGIGTTSPNGLMSIYGTGRLATFRNASTGTGSLDGGYIALNGSDLQIANAESANMIFYTADTERMRLTNSGKVLINTTVSDNGNVTSSGLGTSGNGACYGLVRGSFKSTLGMDSVGNMNIRNFSGEIYVTDSGGSSTTISPHNFSVIPDGASEDLAWSYYSRNGDVENDFDNTKYISTDIAKVIRKVENLTGDKLIYTGTGSTDDGSTVSQNIIQDLITKIESLEAEVNALKNQP
jgi:hypothetical protein